MNSTGVPPPPPPSALADAKTDLNQFCQRYCRRPATKQDVVYVVNQFGNRYQSIVKLNCLQGQEYAGHLSMSAKEAEKSAAHEAILALAPIIEELAQEDKTNTRRKPHQHCSPAQLAEKRASQLEDAENPAITAKTKLNSLCTRIAKRYLQKGETVYESLVVAGGFQATVTLIALPGEWAGRCWAGEVCSSKQKAEQSAAEIALQQLLADPELSAQAERPSGKGSGKADRAGGKGRSYAGCVWQAPPGSETRQRVGDTLLLGEVLEWKDHYGWLRADGEIDHAAISFRDGRIYANKKDLKEGLSALATGARVQFYLYEDSAGLGAEEVALV